MRTLILLALLSLPCIAQSNLLEPVKVIAVDYQLSENLSPVTVTEIKTNTELALQRAGIRLSDNRPYYALRVDVISLEIPGGWAFAVEIHLNAYVNINGDGNKVYNGPGSLWNTGGLYTITTREFNSAVRDRVDSLVRIFLNEWMKQQPAK